MDGPAREGEQAAATVSEAVRLSPGSQVALLSHLGNRSIAQAVLRTSPRSGGRGTSAHNLLLARVVDANVVERRPVALAGARAAGGAGRVLQRDSAPLDPVIAKRVADLDAKIATALGAKPPDWPAAAEALNAFNTDDIFARLANRTEQELIAIANGALQNQGVGRNANIYLIVHGILRAIDPDLFAPSCVFPNCFGDRLGPVGGAVVAAAGGALALRLAWPLLMGAWRYVAIWTAGARVAAEADKEDEQLAEMELGAAVDRLMKADPGGRMLVTYQTMGPAADRELYLTTQQGAQYAEALAQGRNLYQLRIPERLFQLLQDRQLIQVSQGSMYGKVGEDIRIADGAMKFLAQYCKQIPVK